MLKKFLAGAVISILLLLCTTAFAEVIRSDSPRGFAELLSELTSEDGTALFACGESSAFPSDRLVVLGEGNFDGYGAATVLTDSGDTHVLVYTSRSEAERAYYELIKLDNIDVFPDTYVEVTPPSLETDVKISSMTDKAEHLSWGAGFIGADGFNEYLIDKLGGVEAMPKVTVAVIDTGIDETIPMFKDRIDYELAYNLVDPESFPSDDNRHGTHVSGIVADCTLSNVKIIPYKAMSDSGRGSISTIIAAINMALSDGADVINLSVCGEDSSYAYRRKYTSVFESNKTVFAAAAGNFADNVKYYFPANAPNVIAVSACDSGGEFDAEYSNYGTLVDLCAPGTAIRSVGLGGEPLTLSGTSMACPHVSAAAAMIRTLYPSSSPTDVEEYLKSAAIKPGGEVYSEYYGYGILNLDSLCERNTVFSSASASEDDISIVLNANEGEFSEGAVLTLVGENNRSLSYVRSSAIEPGTVNALIRFDFDIELYDSVKAFVWDGFGGMTPICAAETLK